MDGMLADRITAMGPPETDDRLLGLCDEFQTYQRMIDRWNSGKIADEDGEAVNTRWRRAIEDIARTPARTRDGLLAKAAVVQAGILGIAGDDAADPEVTAAIRLALSLTREVLSQGWT